MYVYKNIRCNKQEKRKQPQTMEAFMSEWKPK